MNFFSEISFAGAVVSLFLFLVYNFFLKTEAGGKKYISLIMFISFFLFMYDYLSATEKINNVSFLFVFYYPLIFLLFPLLYKYLLYVASDYNDRSIIKIFNFMPAVVFIISIAVYLSVDNDKTILVSFSNFYGIRNIDPSVSLFNIAVLVLYYIQFCIFVFVFIQMYLLHKNNRIKLLKMNKLVIPQWIFVLIFSIVVYEVIYTMLMIFEFFENQGYLLGQIANLVLLFVVGVVSIKHDELLLEIRLNSSLPIRKLKKLKDKEEIPEEKKTEIIAVLRELMETHKIYRNPNIKIEHIAKRIAVPVNKLSQIINLSFNMNFSQFVNKYRIEEAIELLKEPNAKIEKVFQDVGYYTRSTFNRAFKIHTGVTPTEHLANR